MTWKLLRSALCATRWADGSERAGDWTEAIMRVVFQHGIIGELGESQQLTLLPPFWPEHTRVTEFVTRYGLDPVAVLRDAENPLVDDGFEVVPLASGVTAVGEVEELEARLVVTAQQMYRWNSPAHFLAQQLRAARYHLSQLVMRHVDAVGIVAPSAVALQEWLSTGPDEGASVLGYPAFNWVREHDFGRMCSPVCAHGPLDRVHFETAAVLQAVKRVLDVLPRLMNGTDWARGYSYPNSFHALVNRLANPADMTPEDIRERVLTDWHSWASQVRDFRDCAEHFTTLANVTIPSVNFLVSEVGMLAIVCLLPDNPTARRPGLFTWSRGLDSLSFCNLAYQRSLELADFMMLRCSPPRALGLAAQHAHPADNTPLAR